MLGVLLGGVLLLRAAGEDFIADRKGALLLLADGGFIAVRNGLFLPESKTSCFAASSADIFGFLGGARLPYRGNGTPLMGGFGTDAMEISAMRGSKSSLLKQWRML